VGDHLALVFDGNGDLTNRYLHGSAVAPVPVTKSILRGSYDGKLRASSAPLPEAGKIPAERHDPATHNTVRNLPAIARDLPSEGRPRSMWQPRRSSPSSHQELAVSFRNPFGSWLSPFVPHTFRLVRRGRKRGVASPSRGLRHARGRLDPVLHRRSARPAAPRFRPRGDRASDRRPAGRLQRLGKATRRQLHGVLDDFRIYRGLLTEDQIRTLANE
jgi:hypothetical protein